MKLTKKSVDRIKPDPRERVYWDDTTPGFGLRVRSQSEGGKKSFIIQYRMQGRTRKLTLGPYGRMTLDQARRQARQRLSEVDRGQDPVEARAVVRNDPTLSEFAARYLAEHAEPKKKPKSVAQDQRMLEKIILPKIGRLKLQAIERADVAKLHHSLRESPYQANRVLALLSKMFNLAELWGLRPDLSNPCRHVQKFKEQKRERYLSSEELAKLGTVLGEAEQQRTELPQVILAIRLLLLTGARMSEILTLRWEWVDFEQDCLRLPDSKTGAKLIPLNVPALEALASTVRLHESPFVIPGAKPGAHLVNLNKPWRRIRKKAGIPDVRIHDLRHSYASIAAAAGMGLPVIGALLGHTQAQTTARYAHLAMDPLKAATEEVGRRIAEAMGKEADST